MHRLLIAAISTGAVLIAAIGFTGSYSAVRTLATAKGFGTFAYLFPLGIDAGICVLLALDLLFTRHRIPLPLLRHTAWLLTAATIAFNAAAAWPDLLATGMHAVIPLLFITTIEAARHATGRLAHITANTHMDSVRLARWLLAPAPTFLLWRRMKLWEQRSYRTALTLEQQRLLYQARLRSRYGRAWRHKAPIEALVPLRLTRYGIPLPHTPPTSPTPAADPAAATPANGPRQHTNAEHAHAQPETPQASRTDHPSTPADSIRQSSGPHPLQTTPQTLSHTADKASFPSHWAWWGPAHSHPRIPEPHAPSNHRARSATEAARDNTPPHTQQTDATATTPAAQGEVPPQTAPDFSDGLPAHHHRNDESALPRASTPAPPSPETGATTAPPDHQQTGTAPGTCFTPHHQPTSPTPSPARRTYAAYGPRPPTSVGPASIDYTSHAARQTPDKPHSNGQGNDAAHLTPPSQPTLTDLYYLEWMNYQTQHGTEPTPEQLSTHLATRGLLGRGDKPISPANLRRHLVNWRIYNLWAAQRTHHDTPSTDEVARQCAAQHITGQYNRPITPTYITQHTPEYQRRWHTLTHHNHHEQPSDGQPPD
nr:DUF2637 domain-containing protein [Streptomyces antibioticus]